MKPHLSMTLMPGRNPVARPLLCLIVLLLAGLAAALAADANPQTAADEQALRERGQRIVGRAFAALSGELMRAMAAGGVTNALPVCAEKAGPLLASAAEVEGVTLRRVAARHRNPANAPDELERRILERFATAIADGTPPTPVLQADTDGRVTFFAPIVLNNPLCLRCHGTPGRDILPDHLALIRSLYPEDRATGFALNDLRGLWRVDFPPANATEEKPGLNPDQPKTNTTPNAP